MSHSEYGSSQNTGSGGSSGQVFGDYVLLEQLSESKTGIVWKAQHQATKAVVAVKMLSRAAMTSATMLERFRRQVQILAQLRHPNLIVAYEGGRLEGVPYLVMEYIEGEDLRSRVKRAGPLAVQQAVEYVIQAAAGLGSAHAQGIWHRNVKPGNLMVDRCGAIRVTGFGLAHAEFGEDEGNVALTVQGQPMGTGDYMAPEQALDAKSADARADIYGVGCTLCTLLTGRPPYRAASWVQMVQAHLTAPIPSLQAARRDVPQALDAVFQKMLAKRPEDRYPSMDEVITALRGALAAGAVAPPDLQGPALPSVPSPIFQEPVLPSVAWPEPQGAVAPAAPSPIFQEPALPTVAWPEPQGSVPPTVPSPIFPEPVQPTAAWPDLPPPLFPSNQAGNAAWNAPQSYAPAQSQPLYQEPLTRADVTQPTASSGRSATRNKLLLFSGVVSGVLVIVALSIFWLAKYPRSAKKNAPAATTKQTESVKKSVVTRQAEPQASPKSDSTMEETPTSKETATEGNRADKPTPAAETPANKETGQ